MEKPWLKFKYDLCENEIQCDGRTIAYSDGSIFDIKDGAAFCAAVQDLGIKLSWLVHRANSTESLLLACNGALNALLLDPHVSKDEAIAYLRETIDRFEFPGKYEDPEGL